VRVQYKSEQLAKDEQGKVQTRGIGAYMYPHLFEIPSVEHFGLITLSDDDGYGEVWSDDVPGEVLDDRYSCSGDIFCTGHRAISTIFQVEKQDYNARTYRMHGSMEEWMHSCMEEWRNG